MTCRTVTSKFKMVHSNQPGFPSTLQQKYKNRTLLRVGCCHNLTVRWRSIAWLRGWCHACWRWWCIPHWRGRTIACWWRWSISWLRGWGWSIPLLRGWWWMVYNSHSLLPCSLLPGQFPSVDKHVVNAASKN